MARGRFLPTSCGSYGFSMGLECLSMTIPHIEKISSYSGGPVVEKRGRETVGMIMNAFMKKCFKILVFPWRFTQDRGDRVLE